MSGEPQQQRKWADRVATGFTIMQLIAALVMLAVFGFVFYFLFQVLSS